MNAAQLQELKEAFRCIVSLAHAKPENSKMTCGVYNLRHMSDVDRDPDTVYDVASHVKMYLQSWVIPALEEATGLREEDVKLAMETLHDRREQNRATKTL